MSHCVAQWKFFNMLREQKELRETVGLPGAGDPVPRSDKGDQGTEFEALVLSG